VADQTSVPAAALADQAAIGWLTASADRIAGAATILPPPRMADIDRLLAVAAAGERTSLQARKLFLRQIDFAAAGES
jgi:hypothetical protein